MTFLRPSTLFVVFSLSTTALASPSALTVHEWGTLSSVVASDGTFLEGCQHEEIGTANFIHSLEEQNPDMGIGPMTQGFPGTWVRDSGEVRKLYNAPITQRFDGSFLNFYQEENLKNTQATIEVHFPYGSFSQWYPQNHAADEDLSLDSGYLYWNVELLDEEKGGKLKTPVPPSWKALRESSSNPLESNPDGEIESEAFLHYRGLGNFKIPISLTADREHLYIHNQNEVQAFSKILILNYDPSTQSGNLRRLSTLKPGEKVSLKRNSIASYAAPHSLYLEEAHRILKKDFLHELSQEEANAMLQNIQDSYLLSPGLRVLYVLPKEWLETFVELRINPEPQKTTRVLLGRIEIFLPEEEEALMEKIKNGYYSLFNQRLSPYRHFIPEIGIFAESKLKRILTLLEKEDAHKNRVYIQKIRNFIEKMGE